MQCHHPICVDKYITINAKTKSGLLRKVRTISGKTLVPCGRCIPCRRRKQNEWAFRILEESKGSLKVAFITLTYNDDHLVFSPSGIPTLVPDHVKTFIKNLRYDLAFKDKFENTQTFRYFICGEYGDLFDRPHYHMILFYNGPFSFDQLESKFTNRWIHGFIKFEPGLSAGRAKYCAKYSMKSLGFDYQDAVPPFSRSSRRPGIGKCFLQNSSLINSIRSRNLWHLHDYQGTVYYLPRYYRDYIYSEDERSQHSELLERVTSTKYDIQYREDPKYWKFEFDQGINKDYLTIKNLKKENYGFRYKPKEYVKPFKLSQDDFFGSSDFT